MSKKPVKKPLFTFPKTDRKQVLRDLKARFEIDQDGGIGKHRHRWQTRGWLGNVAVEFRCQVDGCEAVYTRMMTREELSAYSPRRLELKAPHERNVHRVWHDFLKRFREEAYRDDEGIIVPERWRWTGYEMMERVRRWAEKYPEDVTICSCDDDHHSGSLLVIIESRAPRRYMGTSVVYIPQHGMSGPTQFFLYPEERNAFTAALRALTAPMKKSKALEMQDRVQAERAWKKAVKLPPSEWKKTKE